jgi:hypothetical protein
MKIDFETWQENQHRVSQMTAEEAAATRDYLEALEAEVRGSLRLCRNREHAIKDLVISALAGTHLTPKRRPKSIRQILEEGGTL